MFRTKHIQVQTESFKNIIKIMDKNWLGNHLTQHYLDGCKAKVLCPWEPFKALLIEKFTFWVIEGDFTWFFNKFMPKDRPNALQDTIFILKYFWQMTAMVCRIVTFDNHCSQLYS